jgi:phage terminase small subunit
MSELTPKQERFIDEYIKDLNATQAAIKAGYSEKTAGVQGSTLLKNPKISEAIKNRLEDIKSDSIADATEVLEYFTKVMRREEKEKVVVTLKEEVSDWVLGDDGKYRKNTVKRERVEVVEIEAKLSDANTAAIQLAKRYGLINGEPEKTGTSALEDILEAVRGVGND